MILEKVALPHLASVGSCLVLLLASTPSLASIASPQQVRGFRKMYNNYRLHKKYPTKGTDYLTAVTQIIN